MPRDTKRNMEQETKKTKSSPTYTSGTATTSSTEAYTTIGFTTHASVSTDFLSSWADKYDNDDDDGLDIKPNLTVEEIFARGIEEWKRS